MGSSRLLDANGQVISSDQIRGYSVISTDQSLWIAELLPAYKARAVERLTLNYSAAAQRPFTSSALGSPHQYPSTVVDKLYLTARNTQALIAGATSTWIGGYSVAVGALVRASVDNDWIYRCEQSGNTGTVEPAWPLVQDVIIQDGTASWKAWMKWTGEFTCVDDQGVEARRPHTRTQMIQVGLDGIINVQTLLDKRDALLASIEQATSIVDVDNINLTL